MFNQIKTFIQLIISVCKDVSIYWFLNIYRFILTFFSTKTHYKTLFNNATTLEQWFSAGKALDKLEGKEVWKKDPSSPYYEHELLADRLRLLREARESADLNTMIFLLRTSLSRNMGDMGNPKLYEVSHVGTKRLVEEYIDEICKQLDTIAHFNPVLMPLESKIEFFINIQRSYGRTALLLSGGGTFGLSHVGVIKTLLEANLLPKIISGSSAGSIVASAVCVRTDEEVSKLYQPEKIHLDVFEVKAEQGNAWHKLYRLMRHGVLFDVQVLIDEMKKNLGGDITFLEAYNRTRRILNITVSSSSKFEMPRLLNYLTSPDVVIWSAVAASCAIPFVYRSVSLRAKRDGVLEDWNPTNHRYVDGSVEGDLPMQRIAELFNVNHFIVSQVNPHIAPFMNSNHIQNVFTKMVYSISRLVRSEIQHRLNQMFELGIFMHALFQVNSVISQKYYGDITIIPKIPIYLNFWLLANPDEALWTQFMIIGEKAAWHKRSFIKNHCHIELLIDDLTNKLKSKRFERPASERKLLDPNDLYSMPPNSNSRDQSIYGEIVDLTFQPEKTAEPRQKMKRRASLHLERGVDSGDSFGPYISPAKSASCLDQIHAEESSESMSKSEILEFGILK